MERQESKTWTIADMENLPEGTRAELIEGEFYMHGVPSVEHQDVISDLHVDIMSYIRKKNGNCKVYESPFAVYLNDEAGKTNYVMPDLTVICDLSKLGTHGYYGAPDWIIEVTLPSTKRNDYGVKYRLYQESGVREYWIVDLQRKMTVVWRASEDWGVQFYPFGEAIPVGIYPGLEITVGEAAG